MNVCQAHRLRCPSIHIVTYQLSQHPRHQPVLAEPNAAIGDKVHARNLVEAERISLKTLRKTGLADSALSPIRWTSLQRSSLSRQPASREIRRGRCSPTSLPLRFADQSKSSALSRRIDSVRLLGALRAHRSYTSCLSTSITSTSHVNDTTLQSELRLMDVQAPLQNTSTQPIVAVIGTTGVGKSDFAVELALAFETKHAQGSQAESIQTAVSSESQLGSDVEAHFESDSDRARPIEGGGQALVLSADSMQLYRGLPLITNQLTPDEMRGVKHWGVGMVEPLSGDGSWEVGRWCLEAGREVSQESNQWHVLIVPRA